MDEMDLDQLSAPTNNTNILEVSGRQNNDNEHLLPAHFLPEGRRCYDWINQNVNETEKLVDEGLETLANTPYIPDDSPHGPASKRRPSQATVTYTTSSLTEKVESEGSSKVLQDLLVASEEGRFDDLRDLLISNPHLLNARDRDGYTACHRASYSGHQEVLKLLIQFGCNTRARTNDGWEPIHCAVRWGHTDVCKLLLKNGANINASTNGKQTPLHLASVSSDHVAILEMLLLHPEIDWRCENSAGDTAFDIARRSGPQVKLFDLVHDSLNI